MFSSKKFKVLPLFILCIVHGSLTKPLTITDNFVEGRGIGSTIWGWITYPFTWWYTDVTLPDKEQPLQADPIHSNDNIGKPNLNVQCNDQTCTTVKCDKYGCVNVTCNIYDTDLTGECRNYNTQVKPEEPTTPNPLESTSTPQDKKTDVTSIVPNNPNRTTTETSKVTFEDRPLELEAVLSSTVTEIVDKVIATDH